MSGPHGPNRSLFLSKFGELGFKFGDLAARKAKKKVRLGVSILFTSLILGRLRLLDGAKWVQMGPDGSIFRRLT